MTYETVASISQVTSLLMFVAMFLAVVAYALWPKNGARFERAQQRALDLATTSSAAIGSAPPAKDATGFPSPLWGGARGGGTPDLDVPQSLPPCPSSTNGEGTRRRAPLSLGGAEFLARGHQ